METKKNPVAERRDSVSEAITRGKVVHDLLGGTVAMARAKGTYIPKRSGEADAKWEARISDAVLHNAYARTVGYLTGQVFARDVGVAIPAEGGQEQPPLPDLFTALKDDADLQGNNLSVWAGKFFAGALNDGARCILVEFPMVETRTGDGGRLEYKDAASGEWRPKTAEADAANGWRPYFVSIDLRSLLGWRFERINGRQVLTQLRFLESVMEERGRFDSEDKVVEQIRVLEPGRWEVWRETQEANGEKVWALHSQGTTTPMREIPLAVFMPGPVIEGLAARPALEDLAQLNRRHWQATAEHNELMRWVRAPGLFMSGGPENANEMAWGPGTLSVATNENAKIIPIGVEPNSVNASRQELKDLEEQMGLFGLQLLIPQTGDQTATEKALDAAESDSTLRRWALSLRDCLDQAFVYAAQWVGMDESQIPVAEVNTEFHPLSNADPAVIIAAVEKGIFSKELAFNEFRRRSLAPDGMTWEMVAEQLSGEEATAAYSGQGPTLAGSVASRLLGQNQQGQGA